MGAPGCVGIQQATSVLFFSRATIEAATQAARRRRQHAGDALSYCAPHCLGAGVVGECASIGGGKARLFTAKDSHTHILTLTISLNLTLIPPPTNTPQGTLAGVGAPANWHSPVGGQTRPLTITGPAVLVTADTATIPGGGENVDGSKTLANVGKLSVTVQVEAHLPPKTAPQKKNKKENAKYSL